MPPTALAVIVAMTEDRVIAQDGRIPWHYKEDMLHFRKMTLARNVIVGRRTWDSLVRVRQTLPGRHKIVITRDPTQLSGTGIQVASSLEEALQMSQGVVWIIGGAQVYTEALMGFYVRDVDWIDMTIVPNKVTKGDLLYFPPINPVEWEFREHFTTFKEEWRLRHVTYQRK